MASSLLDSLGPSPPEFTAYTGPHRVGTVDVETPAAGLDLAEQLRPLPEARDLPTVHFRLFYPAAPGSRERPIAWFPSPQRHYISAYLQFSNVAPAAADLLSYLPRHLHRATIPVHENAALATPPPPPPAHPHHHHHEEEDERRWPVVVFSHGLGGTRNSYSYLAASLASHGLVVVCPHHRDGSAVLAHVRLRPCADGELLQHSSSSPASAAEEKNSSSSSRAVPYAKVPHDPVPRVWAARDAQLRVRLWELALVHSAVLRLDDGPGGPGGGPGSEGGQEGGEGLLLPNLNTGAPPDACLAQFAGRLRVRGPGEIVWAGHSYGSATVTQFLKSVYYAHDPRLTSSSSSPSSPGVKDNNNDDDDDDDEWRPLLTPPRGSALHRQITSRTPAMLLDMWCFPLRSPSAARLLRLPLPLFDHAGAAADKQPAAGSAGLLTVVSDAFVRWRENMDTLLRVFSPDPTSSEEKEGNSNNNNNDKASEELNLFYIPGSVHVHQSDFCVLFPGPTRLLFGARDPGRALRLNLRAQLQFLRRCGVVAAGPGAARTAGAEMVEGPAYHNPAPPPSDSAGQGEEGGGGDWSVDDDPAILEHTHYGRVNHWKWVSVAGR